MRPQNCKGLLVCFLLLMWVPPALAGMPAPLPTQWEQVLRLNETPQLRLQTISFFLLGLFVSAAAVYWLWNYLQRDFPKLPRLSYGKAVAGVVLWGLLFVIVLAMISGARELMTPGAWKKQGFTYKLNADGDAPPEASPATHRKQHLERLRTALWQFAATHHGRFPSQKEVGQIPRRLWEVPESGGMRYLYIPGLTASINVAVLVYEPELDPDQRWVLQTDGDILALRSKEIHQLLKPEGAP